MMRKVFVVFAFLIASTIGAQDKPKDPPVLPAENKAAILEIQLRMVQTQNQYAQLQQQLKMLQDNFQQDVTALQNAQAQACKAVKVDCDKDWNLNTQTFKFEPKPQQPPAQTPPKK